MKTLFTTLVLSLLVLSVIPGVLAVSVGSGVTPDITTEQFAPRVWMCDSRVVTDDATEPGRISSVGQEMFERINNYAFEGEQIHWKVLVMDKNKIDQNIDVYATIGSSQGVGNDIEANCKRVGGYDSVLSSCNARIDEEHVQWNPDTMAYFDCTFTVETPESMYGEYWVTVEAMDGEGNQGTMAENEYWFFNPVIALSVDGDLTFSDVRPGTDSYSSTLLLGNDADQGSGVLLDMFVSGTDFYDSSSSGARCLNEENGAMTNQLSLSAFRYFATNGAYSTANEIAPTARNSGSGAAVQPLRIKDAEGYVNIGYGTGFNNPSPFYDGFEVIQSPQKNGPFYVGNVLAPGAEMALTFKLSMPEPCVGDFDTGAIYFWGEAI